MTSVNGKSYDERKEWEAEIHKYWSRMGAVYAKERIRGWAFSLTHPRPLIRNREWGFPVSLAVYLPITRGYFS